jgi:hypothetical protein
MMMRRRMKTVWAGWMRVGGWRCGVEMKMKGVARKVAAEVQG